MWNEAMNHAKSAGFTALLIVRDRHEEPCDLAIGAVRVGATVSPVDGAALAPEDRRWRMSDPPRAPVRR
jgi:hypothetical protein